MHLQVPLALFGGTGNYASALYLSAVKSNALDKVESELLDLVEASKRSTTFAQFTKDLSVPKDVRMKAINAICDEAKLSDITRNFLGTICHCSFNCYCAFILSINIVQIPVASQILASISIHGVSLLA